MPARNTLVQLLALYTNTEGHNARRHRQTDRQANGRTDGRHEGANSRSYRVAVRSAKNKDWFIDWLTYLLNLLYTRIWLH